MDVEIEHPNSALASDTMVELENTLALSTVRHFHNMLALLSLCAIPMIKVGFRHVSLPL